MIKHTYRERAIDTITPYDKNSRTHSTKQVGQIMASIKEYGFTNPLLIDEKGVLIAGHGRLEAVKQLNKVDWAENPVEVLPCIEVSGLSEEQRRALVIADNKIALNAGWDFEILKEELSDLDFMGYDMDLLGFDAQEINDILSGIDASIKASEDKDEFAGAYDMATDDFTMPSGDKADFKQITITLKTENAERILEAQSKNKNTELAEGDNYNANANIVWNLIKDRL